MTTSVYLAGPYAKRDSIRESYAPMLGKIDASCTSSWLSETHEVSDGTIGAATDLDTATVSGHALDDIDGSDVFVLFTAEWLGYDGPSSGRHVETGYALARGKHVIVIGEPENIFHRITSGPVVIVCSWPDALLAIQRYEIQQLRETLEVLTAEAERDALRATVERVAALADEMGSATTFDEWDDLCVRLRAALASPESTDAAPRCDTCQDHGRVPWMVESDPHMHQEPDVAGTVACPDCTPPAGSDG